MAKRVRVRARGKWYFALLWQVVIYSAATAALVWVTFLVPGDISHWALRSAQWMLLPLLGGYTAYRATRRGLVNFAAWIAPPVLMAAVYWLITGMPPLFFGAVLLCFFVSIVGASAGEVMNQREAYKWKKN